MNGSSPHVSQVAVGSCPSEHATPPCRSDTLGAGEAVADVSDESCRCHSSHYIYVIDTMQAQSPPFLKVFQSSYKPLPYKELRRRGGAPPTSTLSSLNLPNRHIAGIQERRVEEIALHHHRNLRPAQQGQQPSRFAEHPPASSIRRSVEPESVAVFVAACPDLFFHCVLFSLLGRPRILGSLPPVCVYCTRCASQCQAYHMRRSTPSANALR